VQAALKDKILNEELEFEELLKADDDGDGDVSQSEYILYKLEQVLLIPLHCGDINTRVHLLACVECRATTPGHYDIGRKCQ
jgi:hypothetical protein